MSDYKIPSYYFDILSERANVFQRRFFLLTQKHFRPTIRFSYFAEVYNSLIVDINEIKSLRLVKFMYELCSSHSREGKINFDSKKEFQSCILPFPNFSNEVIKRCENAFVRITLIHFPFRDLDFNYLADVLSGFQLHRETYVTPREAQAIFYKGTFIGHPVVHHFIDDANIFQRGFIYCAAKHFAINIDFAYLITTFNGLTIDAQVDSQVKIDTYHDEDHDFDVIVKSDQGFPPDWIVDYYKSLLRLPLLVPERNECHPSDVVNYMQMKFVRLTKQFSKHVDYNFATDVINFFRENNKKTPEQVEAMFCQTPSISCSVS